MKRACRSCGTPVPHDALFGRCSRCITVDPVLERRARTGAWSPWRDKTEQASFRRALMERAGGRCEYLHDGILRCPSTEDLQAHHGQHGGGMLLCKLHHRELDKYAR